MASVPNGSVAASAIAHLRKGGSTIPISRGIEVDFDDQYKELIEWARGCNRLLDYNPPLDAQSSSGTEHDVYFHQEEGRVFKKTKDRKFGSIRTQNGTFRTATPFYYLRRLEWCNEVFYSDLRLEYVIPKPGRAIVISQPIAEAEKDTNPLPSVEEICEFMEKMGFKRVKQNPQEWYRPSDFCSACDAKRENFIKTTEGIRPIDLIISKELGYDPLSL